METKKKLGIFQNLLFSYTKLWRSYTFLVISCFLNIVISVARPLLAIYMPKVVIGNIEKNVPVGTFLLSVSLISAAYIVVHYISEYISGKLYDDIGTSNAFEYSAFMTEKQMTIQYELMQDAVVKEMENKALIATDDNHKPAMTICNTFTVLIANILGFIIYGSIIVSVSPLVLVIILINTIVNVYLLKWARKKEQDNASVYARTGAKISYFMGVMRDTRYAKDIRLFRLTNWLKNITDVLIKQKKKMDMKRERYYDTVKLADILFIFLRDGLAYAFLIHQVINKEILVSDFVLIFAAVGSFADWLSNIITNVNHLFRASTDVTYIRRYLDYPDEQYVSGENPMDTKDGCEIVFDHVSYAYPGCENVLKDISFTIKKGENISVVGINGAGKTTLVKLLCGLYKPSRGDICINGTNVKELELIHHYNLLAPVFQDTHLLTASIALNISQKKAVETDVKRVDSCIEQVGLGGEINKLLNGKNTMLVKQYMKEGIDLSGGEMQKISMARAIYKDAPILILDEPTAALDPVAENEIYMKYAELTRGKTSIFISHRMASTRFCDRIFLIANGMVAESGTHDELIALEGQYSKLFKIQSSYYNNTTEMNHVG